MEWEKMGLVYVPDGSRSWAKKYAFPPVPYALNDEKLRIYLTFCDENMVGRMGYVDVAASEPSRVLEVSERPLLDIGQPGTFDENGLLPTCILPVGDDLYVYYVGYQLGYKVRYYQFAGLAISRDGGRTFTRERRTPILERSDAELVNRTSTFVMHENGTFRMWYVGGSDWTTVNGKTLPVYDLKYLESRDGKNWGPTGRTVLEFEGDEHAFGKPWIIKEDRRYSMWYSVRTRSKGYRLGYAESKDGIVWDRHDDRIGIDVSASGWDSQMIAYAAIHSHRDQTYMFYNGNNCGETGFGYAKLKSA